MYLQCEEWSKKYELDISKGVRGWEIDGKSNGELIEWRRNLIGI